MREIPLNPTLAYEIGIKEALILSQINFWLQRKPHWRDGKPWIYNTYDEWQRQLCCYSYNAIRQAINKLEGLGLVQSGEYNRSRRDRTKWYSIDYEHPVLVSLGIKWKSPKIPHSTPNKKEHLTRQNIAGATAKKWQAQLSQNGSSNQYMKPKNEQQKIILKGEEDWPLSLSLQQQHQIKLFVEEKMSSVKSVIHDRLAYQTRIVQNIREGKQEDFRLRSDDEYIREAEHYGPLDLETLRQCTPPAEWSAIKAKYESDTAGVSTAAEDGAHGA